MQVKKQSLSPMGEVPEEMTLINQLSRRELTAEEVYTFGIRLCDNQTDRDGEYFAREDLEILAELFVGKTGIFDHSWSAKDQTGRIYRTEIMEEPGVITESGEPGCYLKGYAYMLRTPENESLIQEIEGGIKKEVSISCAVSRCVCSVCGCDVGTCGHARGQVYDGRRCVVRLAEPTDAYEWSFVAVPAQRQAGVVKSFSSREDWDRLEKEAAAGRAWLKSLREETVRLGLLAEMGLDGNTLRSISEKLDVSELEALKGCFSRRVDRSPLGVQLPYGTGSSAAVGNDDAFLI